MDNVTEGAAPKGSIAVAAEGAAFAIPLEGLIDIAEEKSRLQKALDKLMKEIGYGKEYKYTPDFKNKEDAKQEYLPEKLKDRKYIRFEE